MSYADVEILLDSRNVTRKNYQELREAYILQLFKRCSILYHCPRFTNSSSSYTGKLPLRVLLGHLSSFARPCSVGLRSYQSIWVALKVGLAGFCSKLMNVLGQLLVFFRPLLSCSTRIVFAQMCILLYYWANKMMMMMKVGPGPRQENETNFIGQVVIAATACWQICKGRTKLD